MEHLFWTNRGDENVPYALRWKGPNPGGLLPGLFQTQVPNTHDLYTVASFASKYASACRHVRSCLLELQLGKPILLE
jgi:hypothetical protein